MPFGSVPELDADVAGGIFENHARDFAYGGACRDAGDFKSARTTQATNLHHTMKSLFKFTLAIAAVATGKKCDQAYGHIANQSDSDNR